MVIIFKKSSAKGGNKPYHPLKKRNGMVKCQINQIASLIKVSILKATNSESVGSFAGPHDGSAAIEVEATRTGTANRTAPIVAVRTDIE